MLPNKELPELKQTFTVPEIKIEVECIEQETKKIKKNRSNENLVSQEIEKGATGATQTNSSSEADDTIQGVKQTLLIEPSSE